MERLLFLGVLGLVVASAQGDNTNPHYNTVLTNINLDIAKDRNVSKLVLSEELEKWEAPVGFPEKFPYFLSGFDEENRPIWIVKIGKFQFRDAVLQGKEMQETLSKYLKQFAYRVRKSRTRFDPKGKTNFILDFDGLSFPQFSEINTIAFILRQATDYSEALDSTMNKAVLVNANYVTESLVNLVRPIFGRIFANVDIYGTNRAKWVPNLVRLFPQDQLPEYYGGFKDHKAVQAYGASS